MPEVILWDVMDTLVRDPFFTHMADFFGLSFDELLRRKHPSTWGKFELGKLDEQGLFEQFFADGTPIDGPAFKQCVRDAYAWIDGIEPLLIELKKSRVPMHALSNYPPWYALIEERLQLSRYVDLTFFSCDTGVRKPAAEAYLGACRTLARRPEQCLFVDDRSVNADAARAVGLQALQFTGDVAALRASLRELGFLHTWRPPKHADCSLRAQTRRGQVTAGRVQFVLDVSTGLTVLLVAGNLLC